MPCAGKHSCTSSKNNVLKALFVLMPPSMVNKPMNCQYLYQRKAKTLFCGKFFKSYMDPCAYLLKWSRYAPVCDTCISNTPSEKLLDRLNLLIIGFNFLVDNLGPVVRRPISANPGLNFNPGLSFFSSKAFSRTILSILFRVANHQIVDKKN